MGIPMPTAAPQKGDLYKSRPHMHITAAHDYDLCWLLIKSLDLITSNAYQTD